MRAYTDLVLLEVEAESPRSSAGLLPLIVVVVAMASDVLKEKISR